MFDFIRILLNYLVICDSMNISMNTRPAGITAAKHAHTGKDWDMPIGLITQARRLSSVGLSPSGTSSFSV